VYSLPAKSENVLAAIKAAKAKQLQKPRQKQKRIAAC
jgi:predicted transcriptional regulator